MSHLVDTNILLRFINASDPEHVLVRDAVRALLLQGEALYYLQQNRREFWNVSTRPAANNGLGLSVEQTIQRLAELDAVFIRLPDRAESGAEWDRLVTQYRVVGRAVHDAQLAASMLVGGITRLLTLNVEDFPRYPEIRAVHPRDVSPRGAGLPTNPE